MGDSFDRLRARLAEIQHIGNANAVLGWDQQTYMPPGGARARAAQMATLSQLGHDLFTAPETGELLQGAAEETDGEPYDSFAASLVRVAQRDYGQARKVPSSLVAAISQHAALSHGIWARARAENDFAAFAPCLSRTIELSRELAMHLGYEDVMYDALLDQFEPGMKTAQVRQIFADLKADLIPLVQAISERVERVSDAILHQPYDEARQEEFGKMVVRHYGYDFQRGRQDRTVHPFATSFSRDDVRITTRFDPTFLNPALFGTMHEAGHGMYEQGIGEELEGTPLAGASSLGFHESQSRLWENVVGRSRAVWQHFYPALQATFPEALGAASLDDFYRAINKVAPSYIRVEADEVTYNLHIMLRFEMEQELLEGAYPIREAPAVWDDKMEAYLGLRPPTNTLGILQDTHWSGGMVGYFPTYSLGNLLSVQLYNTAITQHPEIPEQIAAGEFSGLREWLTENVYRHGRKFEPNELVQRVTGEPLQSHAYVAYLRGKFGEIYGL